MGNAEMQSLSLDAVFNRLLEAQANKFIAIIQEQKINSSGPEVEAPINIEEASKFLDKEVSTLYTLVQKGQIPYHKKLRKLYFFKSELVQWIKESEDDTAELEKEFLTANKKRRQL